MFQGKFSTFSTFSTCGFPLSSRKRWKTLWKRLKSELFTKKVDKKPLYDYYTTRQSKNQVRFYFSRRKKHKNFYPFFVDNKQKKNSQIESSVKKYIIFYKMLRYLRPQTTTSWVWRVSTAFSVVKIPTFCSCRHACYDKAGSFKRQVSPEAARLGGNFSHFLFLFFTPVHKIRVFSSTFRIILFYFYVQ